MKDFYFIIYKSISQIIMPIGVTIAGLMISGLLFCLGKNKSALCILGACILWLWVWSMPVWSDYIRGTLESKFKYHPPAEYPTADAIVVLGGGVRGYAGPHLPLIDLNRAADRELFASQLMHANRSKVIILSGGADPIFRTGTSALGMKIFLINLGIPASAIKIGSNSRNTIENVNEVVEMLKPVQGKTILLVTSALHMQRAYWLFARTGLNIIPAPADFEVVNSPFSFYRLLPDAEALENSSRATREIIGLWAYRLGIH